jgi:hypothetical protein
LPSWPRRGSRGPWAVAGSGAAAAALGLVASATRATLERLALATALGIGIAGLPVVLAAALLPEATLGSALASPFGLRETLHPAALVQALLPGVLGSPLGPPVLLGNRFFAPAFGSSLLGPQVLAFAAIGMLAAPRRLRLSLLGIGGLGLGLALATGGLGLLLPQLAVAVAAGFAVDRLLAGRDWRGLAAAAGALAALALGIVLVVTAPPAVLSSWTGVAEPSWPQLFVVARRGAGLVRCSRSARGRDAGSGAGILRPRALGLVVALCLADLARSEP